MKTASIGIEAPTKGKIRTFVATKNCLGCFFKNVGIDGWRCAKKFPDFSDKRVGGLVIDFIVVCGRIANPLVLSHEKRYIYELAIYWKYPPMKPINYQDYLESL